MPGLARLGDHRSHRRPGPEEAAAERRHPADPYRLLRRGGLATEQLAALAPDEDDLLIVADGVAVTEAGMPLLAVHVSGEDEEDRDAWPGVEELRVVAEVLWSVENDISVADMDGEEFVDAAGEDGVFRGF